MSSARGGDDDFPDGVLKSGSVTTALTFGSRIETVPRPDLKLTSVQGRISKAAVVIEGED